MSILLLIFACIFFVIVVNAMRSGNRPIRKNNPKHDHTHMWPGDSQTNYDSSTNEAVPPQTHSHHGDGGGGHHHGDSGGGHHGGGHDGGGDGGW